MKKSIICITLAAIASGTAGGTLAQQKPEVRHDDTELAYETDGGHGERAAAL